MKKIFNFNAGPSMLPKAVLVKIKNELFNWNNTKVSIMEISHRNQKFLDLIEIMKKDLKDLLNIPKNYNILFLQGGARTQFSSIPINLIKNASETADYINSGYWGEYAACEAKKYCIVNLIDVIYQKKSQKFILPMKLWKISKNSKYIHYCPNETIDGIAIHNTLNFKNKIIIGDFSSTFLSSPIDINKFGIIYASSQKNIGPSGMTVVIFRNDLVFSKNITIPSCLNYQLLYKHNSLFNTPPTFTWYASSLVLKWLKSQGGLLNMHKINQKKSKLLYNAIDKSNFYHNNIAHEYRSYMNVIFHLPNETLNNLFLKLSQNSGLLFLQGHRVAGGIRASLYNAMPISGVKKLIKFMKYFEKNYG
ncbi:3-phosphoserine/phosphohydroxythreonine aminotransferase [Wigglesworthia glossinidia endosymbiont of Glossina morsitans morsitans (Yale colony)]|uniref:Phosphoserine aminotransferase n=1 Tax=Wigglesworthia glossinidia endosymbiont of Glossina morsitans morsitans (Yale colony) TaxID=1142511 RepID=H6Q4Q1_WIGGL|nr:3-phosphoserine/phosphohydroxythreonine transaminase [Wigglesworthia glossinidia]AFA41111.1 3-phosphoserine/phosphohydroxythreonine aminotransferase [Wigglesworthia glossinidia endosymbiont of Glossina morsitans morsitans (Yale colony)]